MTLRTILFAAVLMTLAAGCAPVSKAPTTASVPGVSAPAASVPTKPPRSSKVQLRPTTFAALPGWSDDRHSQALLAFQKSCRKIIARPADRMMASNADAPGGTVAQWRSSCRAALDLNTRDDHVARRFFEVWFVPYEVSDTNNPKGLFTGYYEPELNGAWRRGGKFQTPLYARPADLISVSLGAFEDELGGTTIWGRVEGGKLKPYRGRAQIENGGANGLQPLLWVDDPVDAFFLHVQGSGRVRMSDGAIVRLGFAAKNGRPYKSIGRILIDSGEIPANRLTMDAIRNWVHARPVEGPKLLSQNPSFVFFRLLKGEGPIGAQGVALTSGRSLAVDRRYLPLGAPLWLTTHEPLDANQPLQRLMVTQDTGGAIKGVVRGDIFFGSGLPAAKQAGNMKRPGRYYLLLPNTVFPRQAQN